MLRLSQMLSNSEPDGGLPTSFRIWRALYDMEEEVKTLKVVLIVLC